MLDVLTACLRRCCGLHSSTLVGKAATLMAAMVVGDPASRSRAILLRYGAFKRDAVMWVSSRGGLMCSCYSGTQNALLLTESAGSSDCQHTALLRRCLPAAGVPVHTFQKRMQLRHDAANLAISTKIGTTVLWTALYQSVFSLVSFTPGNVTTCIAPRCRCFRGRCGHFKVARPLNAEYLAAADTDALLRSRDTIPAVKGVKASEQPSCLVSPE